MTGPTLDDMVRVSVARGLAAIDWETRCATAERDREEARDLVRRVEANAHIRHPYPLSDELSVAVRRWHDDEARGDDAPSPAPGSGGGPPAPAHQPTRRVGDVWEGERHKWSTADPRIRLVEREADQISSFTGGLIETWRAALLASGATFVATFPDGHYWRLVERDGKPWPPESPAHHTPASDDDRVIVVLTRGEAVALSVHLTEITRLLGDELAQSFDATAAVHGSHSAGAAFQPPVRSGAIDDADTPLTPGDLDRIAEEAAARHLEGAAADTTPLEVLGLVQMARGSR